MAGTLIFIFKTLSKEAVRIWGFLCWCTTHTNISSFQARLTQFYVADVRTNDKLSISSAKLSPDDWDIFAKIKYLFDL